MASEGPITEIACDHRDGWIPTRQLTICFIIFAIFPLKCAHDFVVFCFCSWSLPIFFRVASLSSGQSYEHQAQFCHGLSQWETTLHCNGVPVSHWVIPCIEWSLSTPKSWWYFIGYTVRMISYLTWWILKGPYIFTTYSMFIKQYFTTYIKHAKNIHLFCSFLILICHLEMSLVTSSLKKPHLKLSSAKCRPLCFDTIEWNCDVVFSCHGITMVAHRSPLQMWVTMIVSWWNQLTIDTSDTNELVTDNNSTRESSN